MQTVLVFQDVITGQNISVSATEHGHSNKARGAVTGCQFYKTVLRFQLFHCKSTKNKRKLYLLSCWILSTATQINALILQSMLVYSIASLTVPWHNKQFWTGISSHESKPRLKKNNKTSWDFQAQAEYHCVMKAAQLLTGRWGRLLDFGRHISRRKQGLGQNFVF